MNDLEGVDPPGPKGPRPRPLENLSSGAPVTGEHELLAFDCHTEVLMRQRPLKKDARAKRRIRHREREALADAGAVVVEQEDQHGLVGPRRFEPGRNEKARPARLNVRALQVVQRKPVGSPGGRVRLAREVIDGRGAPLAGSGARVLRRAEEPPSGRARSGKPRCPAEEGPPIGAAGITHLAGELFASRPQCRSAPSGADGRPAPGKHRP